MVRRKDLAAGILIGMGLGACAGATFPYKYYGVDLKDQKLLGPTAQDDMSLAVCNATASDQSPCTAMLTDDYLALKKDYLEISQQLIDCQKPKPGG